MCDFLFLIEKINKITMMKPRGMGARASQGRVLLHRLLCWPVGTSTWKALSGVLSLVEDREVEGTSPGAVLPGCNSLGLLGPH